MLNFYIKAGYHCDRQNMKKLNKKSIFFKGKGGIDILCKLALDIPSSFVPWHRIYRI
uniref:Uncharacterized protein n=1 Tax=Meloidogyne enterolobii TaxID=390850 RepID=A0A6V7UBS5_MELEN|nr:unnamed protein product [Meloidogyne enterolobii]